jgi:hypothetical protein
MTPSGSILRLRIKRAIFPAAIASLAATPAGARQGDSPAGAGRKDDKDN